TASGGGGVVTLENRDGYYGGYFSLPTGSPITWRASFEADATEAQGPVQIGLTYCVASLFHPCTSWGWVGTRWGGSGGVPAGQGWTQVTATFQTPANATAAALWFQIDAPWNAAGRARFRNLSLTTSVPVEIPLTPMRLFNPAPSPAAAPILRVGGDLNISGPLGQAGLEGDTQLTFRAAGSIRILGDLLSAAPPCRSAAGVAAGRPVPSDCPGGGRGVLGLYAESGDVLLARNAPSEVYLTAVIAAPRGTFGPEGYPSSMGVGSVFLQGAFAAQNYRSFLSPDGSSGWQLRFAYDPRLSASGNLRPPGWPELPRDVWGVSVVYTRESTP
ncbi:hypothetical protein, partial [Fervidobacterium sp.]